MNNHNENILEPKIRFPEFKTDKWKAVALHTLGETHNGLNGKSAADFGKGKPFVTYKQVFDSSRVDLSKCALVEIAGNENQSIVQKGDVLFTTSSETPNEVGFASVILSQPIEPTYLNSFCFSFRPFSLEKLLPEFSQYLFHSPIFRKSITVLAQGITRFNISKVAFLNLNVPIPNNPNEQQKIAATLSSLDDLITAQNEKIKALQAHKKGLMQQLFPAEGERVPRLRFPEFLGAGDWEEKTIGEIFNSFSGGTPSTSEREYYGGKIPFIRSAEINRDRTELFITEKGLKNSSAKLINEGDLLVALYGANSGDSAISKINGAINQAILCLQSEYSNIFTHNFLTLKKDWIISKFIQGGQGNISGEIVKSITIPFPKNTEQQKIASILSSLDDLIKTQNQKLEALKKHKKGLIQQLFPNPNDLE